MTQPSYTNIIDYLDRFAKDLKHTYISLHRRQIEAIYLHEPWLGPWRCYYHQATRICYAVNHYRGKSHRFVFQQGASELQQQQIIRTFFFLHPKTVLA